MCGIVGYVSREDHNCDAHLALQNINHRGPDGRGVFSTIIDGKNVFFGHTRLTIRDFSVNSAQPLIAKNSGNVLVYNGEIYNTKQLDTYSLNAFDTGTSDTLSLSHFLESGGGEALNLIEGMFAFALLDTKNQEVSLVRDPFGIKPLYFHASDKGLFFASELKALLSFEVVPGQIDMSCLTEFLNFGYLHEPATGLKSVVKVFPGTRVRLDIKTMKITSENYIQLLKTPPATDKMTSDMLDEALRSNLVADVPVGTFYSAGIDSLTLAHFLKTKNFFISSKLNGAQTSYKNPDLFYAKKLAMDIGIPFTNIEYEAEDLSITDMAAKVVEMTEEPISDLTAMSTYEISRNACEAGYKVMLSGLGADELFWGYRRLKLLWVKNLLMRVKFVFVTPLKLAVCLGCFGKKINTRRLRDFWIEDEAVSGYSNLVGFFEKKDVIFLLGKEAVALSVKSIKSRMKRYLGKSVSLEQPLDAYILELYGFLSHNNTVLDKASMKNSLEVRVPFLSQRFFSFGTWVQRSFLKNFIFPKYLLKTALIQKGIPFSTLIRKKQGFNPNYRDTFSENFSRELVSCYGFVELRKFLNNKKFDRLVAKYLGDLDQYGYCLWQFIVFNEWCKLVSNRFQPIDKH